jgi:DNA/RNA endonuclease G (NUC1)
VPTHFFKVVVCETDNNDLELEAFVLPNEKIPDNTPLASFQVFLFKFFVVGLWSWSADEFHVHL